MAQERADVLVIGSGAAGGALAWRLTELGARVVCLEQGDWVTPAAMGSAQLDYEKYLLRGAWHFDPNVRQKREDYPVISTGDDPVNVSMFNAVGGTTIHWQGHFPRFHPSDFRVESLDGVAEDWPVSYDELEPYYDLNDRMMGVSGLSGDPANPPRSPRPTPPLPLGVLGHRIAGAFESLGWHWWVGDQAILSEAYGGRPPCLLHGKCMFGCPIGAKASTDRVYWPGAIEKGAVLKTWARVREILVGRDGRVRGATYFDRDGNEHEELARIVVVCCNGVGTPRLLLNSTSSLFPDGLANSSGMVGRNFMVHPARWLPAVMDEVMDGHIGPFGVPLFSQEFYETDTSRGFVRGYTLAGERNFGPLSHALSVPWGSGHHRLMKTPVSSHRHRRCPMRGSARSAQSRRARPQQDRCARDPRGPGHVPARGKLTADAGPWAGTSQGGAGGRRSSRDPGADRKQHGAPDGDRPHGKRPEHVRGRCLESGSRRAQPLRGGRQLVHDVRRSQPDLHHRRTRLESRGRDLGAAE